MDNNRIVLLKYLAKYVLLLIFACTLTVLHAQAQCGLTINITKGPQTGTINLNCAPDCDGAILVNVSGGGGNPYTYAWSTVPPQTIAAATGLCAGTYTVTITDAVGCVTIAVDSIVAPAPVVAVFTAIPSCFGMDNGTAIVNVGGGCSGLGTCPYDYTFTNVTTSTSLTGQVDSIFPFTPLAPGDYTISATDQNNCPSGISSVTITELTPFTVASGSTTTPFCPGDCNASVFIGMAGSLQPYTFAWSDGTVTFDPGTNTFISNLCAGTYHVSVTDSVGCTKDSLNLIVLDPPIVIDLSSSTDPTCAGICDGTASIVIQSGGTAPFSYLWNSGQNTSSVTGLCSGPISVTVTDDHGCLENDTHTLGQQTALESDTTTSAVICASGGTATAIATITVTTGSPPYAYLWSSGATSSAAAGLTMGETYNVTVVDASGCTLTESVYVVPEPCPIVVPNTFSPNDDGFNDTWFIENLILYTQSEIKVYNRWGDIVFRSTGYDTPWDGQYASVNLPAAVYYYVIDIPEVNENHHGSLTIIR